MSLVQQQPGMKQIYEEMLLRKDKPSKDDIWMYKLTRPGVQVFVKCVRNIKKTMQQIVGRKSIAIRNHQKYLMTSDTVYLLLKGVQARSWLGLFQLDTNSGRSSTDKSDGIPTQSEDAWRDEYLGREDYTVFHLVPALRSVVSFEYTRNTYVKVKSAKRAIFAASDELVDFEGRDLTEC